MYAVIMAGGEGSRLRPLTLGLPKPLVPVAGRPAMSRIVELLSAHKIKKAAVTTHYKSEMIDEYYKGLYRDVELRCFYESTPLGTAGSVKNTLPMLMCDGKDDSFIIISGDAVCELDLTAAIDFHKRKNADVTIILSKADAVGEYGVVECAPTGEVVRFIEKPGPAQAFTNTVNTGIYIMKRIILDLIPEGKPYDFGRDLFPELLRRGGRMFGKNDRGYWCDIGDIGAYYDCNMRMGRNEGSLDSRGNVVNGACVIGDRAVVRNSVICDGVIIGAGAHIDSAVICENARIGRNAVIRSGCVVGSGTSVGVNAVVDGGARLTAGIKIENGAVVMGSSIFGGVSANIFKDGGVSADIEMLTPEYAVRLGGAFGSASGAGKVGVLCDGSPESRMICDALLCGIRSVGGEAFDLIPDSCGFDSIAAYAAVRLGLDASLSVSINRGRVRIAMFDRCGIYPKRSFERGAAAYMAVGGGRKDAGRLIRYSGLTEAYRAELAGYAVGLAGLRVCVSGLTAASDTLAQILTDAGAVCTHAEVDGSDSIRLHVNPEGSLLTVYKGREMMPAADMWHVTGILLKEEAERGVKEIALPYHAPDELDKLASSYGITSRRYASSPYDNSEDEIRAIASNQLWTRDGIASAIMLCSLLSKNGGDINALVSALPSFCVKFADINAEKRPMTDLGRPAQEGVTADYRIGSVKILPRTGGYRIYAEASRMEAAAELVALVERKILESADTPAKSGV